MIERIFLGWSRPLLPLAVSHLVEHLVQGDVLDLRAHQVVLPGGRGGRRFKELLLEESRKRNLRLVPPRVSTVGFLPELLHRPGQPLAGQLESRRAWSLAARRAPSGAIDRLFGARPEDGDWRGWERIASELARLHLDVGSAGYLFGDVREVFAAGDLPFDDGRRWEMLAGIQATYLALLASLGLADREALRIAALERDVASDGPLWLVGVADMPDIARRLLLLADSPVNALIHAPDSEAASFDDVGRVEPSAWEARRLTLAADQLRVVDRPTGQAAEVVRGVSELGSVRRSDIVVAAADPSLAPYLDDWFGAVGLPLHEAAGVPVERTGPWQLLAAVAAFLDRQAWPEFAALARHPDLDDRLRRAGVYTSIGKIDEYFRDHLPGDLTRPLPEGGPDDARKLLRAFRSEAFLGRFATPRPLREWGKVIIDFLLEVYGDVPLDRTDPARRQTMETLLAMRAAALEIYRLPEPLSPTADASEAIDLLLEQIRGTAIAVEGREDSVEMLGWLELGLDDAPHVFVVGVNEGFLPASILGHAFLPDHLRTRLGVANNRTRYARDAFLLEALNRSRKTLTLVSGRVTPDGDPLRPSRLTLTVRGPELARRVVEFTEGRAPRVEAPLVAAAANRTSFRLPPEPKLDFDPPEKISVTGFKSLLNDPYRWAIDSLLRIESTDDGWREVDAARFGFVAHDVLAEFGRSPVAASDDVDEVRNAFNRILDDQWAARFGDGTFPAVTLQRELLRMRLNQLAIWQAEWAGAGWRPYLIEGRRVGEPEGEDDTISAPFVVDGETITLRGRLDRVDWNERTRRIAVLDYKTGEAPIQPREAHLNRNGWKDLQLPLYRHLLKEIARRDDFPAGGLDHPPELGYILLSRDLEQARGETAEWTEEELEQADETAREVIRELRKGRIEFDRDRVRTFLGDPLRPLLGMRLLLEDERDPEADDEEIE